MSDDWSEVGSQFHVVGLLTAKLRWRNVVLVRGTSMTPDDADRKCRQLAHRGQPGSEEHFHTNTAILKWRVSRTGVTWLLRMMLLK